MLPIIKSVFRAVYGHYAGLMTGFDSLVEVQDFSQIPSLKEYQKLASRYWLACIVSGSVMAEIIFKCFYYQTFRLPEESNHLLRVITRVWPASLEQRDFICFGGYVLSTLYYFTLLFDKSVHYDWFMYYSIDKKNVVLAAGKALPTTLATKLLAFWIPLRPRISILLVLTIINTNLCTTLIFYIGEAFFPSPNTGTFWNIIFMFVSPVLLTYISYIVIYSCMFWVQLKILIIKQEHYIGWFDKLINRSVHRKQGSGSKNESGRSAKKALRDYFDIIKTLVTLMSELRSFNRYWSKYMTIVLTIFSVEICYVSFAIVTTPTMEKRLQFAPLSIYPITFSLYIYLISSISSRVVINNKLIHRGIRRFNFRCRTDSIYFRVKMETFDCFQKFFAKSAFRTLNNYTIDLKLFGTMASWIFFFSLKLFGRQLAAHF